jgi:hypothetical protein
MSKGAFRSLRHCCSSRRRVNLAAAILVDGLIDASWLFIVPVGLTLVFGVLNILNTRFGAARDRESVAMAAPSLNMRSLG